VSRKKSKKRRRSKGSNEPAEKERTVLNRSDTSSVDDGWDIGDEIPLPQLQFKKKEEAAPEQEPEAEPAEAAKPAFVDDEEHPEAEVHVEGAAVAAMASTDGGAHDINAENERMMEAVKALNDTDDRNRVFDILLEHLSHIYERVGFFAVKKGNVCAWKGLDLPESDAEVAAADSIFGNVVTAQLPYRGPVDDKASTTFLTEALGAAPDEVIAMPVAIGPRVIGVLCGDGRHGTVFEQQLAMVTRTAGTALERIIKSKKK
jgi:hypothetical protein